MTTQQITSDQIVGGGGGGDITTDPAWAAKGNLIVGTANDTAAILTAGANGKVLSADSAQTTGLAWISQTGLPTGTSFPGSPSTNDLFYRTDLSLLCFYDGTRWLSLNQYSANFERNGSVAEPIAASTTAYKLMPLSEAIWVENLYYLFFVNSGGTALGASHKWVLTLRIGDGGTTISTVNIDSGASNAFRGSSNLAINQATTTSDLVLEWSATKTGTPGSLQSWPRVEYRRILT